MSSDRRMRTPELWAGAECSVVRIGDSYYDQLARTGHAERREDLKLIADLGPRAVRCPVLWERTQPHQDEEPDWCFADYWLPGLRERNIRPIVGLLHHGSGPRWTGLLDPQFPDALARYAHRVATRYPWVADYTPVNEPLTTARFAALYGHWSPHRRSAFDWAVALLNQCQATCMAMSAIRSVNPHARLVQTEDLAKTHGTPRLQYQIDFENERRWLSLDLLLGRVRPGHAMWDYLLWLGIDRNRLVWFHDHVCAPDIMGFNYYLTSERFLEERIHLYPRDMHGGNARDSYVDLEAVRMLADGIAGPQALLREAWERYGTPLAVTEAHLGCTREEQVRWFRCLWDAACALRADGIDCRAVTLWAAFGSYDWNSLMTRDMGHYEPGAFDLRGPTPRPTAVAKIARALGQGHQFDDSLVAASGWWERDHRLSPHSISLGSGSRAACAKLSSRPILIVGAGRLAKVVAQYCHVRGLVTAQSPDRLARGDEATLDSLLTSLRPAAIVHVSPLTHSERAPEGSIAQLRSCVREAVMAAEAACRHGLPLVCISSYRVFSASRDEAFTELDPPNPACLVGGLFRRLEQRVASSCPHALLMRVGELLDPESTADPLAGALVAIRSGCQVVADDRLRFTPAMIHDVASAALDLLIDGESGYWHLANTGEADSLALLRHVATLCGLDDQLAVGRPTTSHHEVRRVLIDSVRGRVLPPLDDAIHRYARQVARHLTAIDAHERERSHAPRQGNTIGILAMTSDPTNTVEAVEVL